MRRTPLSAVKPEIRRLQSIDGDLYREIRLEALRQNPEAFSSTFDYEAMQGPAWFANRLARSAVFGAFLDGTLVGIASFYVEADPKETHKGTLAGMYVRPAARRAGIGRRLVEVILEHARGSVELVRLAVVTNNRTALQLYRRLGFTEYGFEEPRTAIVISTACF